MQKIPSRKLKQVDKKTEMINRINADSYEFAELPFVCFCYDECEMRDHNTCAKCKVRLLNSISITEQNMENVYVQ
jgi:hypothetical protein